VTVINKLVQSHGGYEYLHVLHREILAEVIVSFMEYNVFHLRPHSILCKDIDPLPVSRKAILTAETKPDLFAREFHD